MARDDTRRARSARRACQAVHLADRDRTAEHWNKNGSSAREGAGCPGRVFVGSLKALARKHRLYLYDVPSLEGSDAYGFILSREKLSEREIQQIEADYWGENFDDVYPSQ